MKRKSNKNIGLSDSRLKRCPNRPNCICTQYPDDGANFKKPWTYTVDRRQVMNTLLKVLTMQPRAKLVTEEDNYLHAEFTLPLAGFVDDVEFFLPGSEKVIHYRSASRVGFWDIWQNRLRLSRIKSQLKKAELGIS